MAREEGKNLKTVFKNGRGPLCPKLQWFELQRFRALKLFVCADGSGVWEVAEDEKTSEGDRSLTRRST